MESYFEGNKIPTITFSVKFFFFFPLLFLSNIIIIIWIGLIKYDSIFFLNII